MLERTLDMLLHGCSLDQIGLLAVKVRSARLETAKKAGWYLVSARASFLFANGYQGPSWIACMHMILLRLVCAR